MPPELERLDTLLADWRVDAERAWSTYLDELLDLPAHAEHLATAWLDFARYADSNGYEKDDGRSIWPYRDWDIQAFADDQPFDEFTRLQLAGDLLPDPTPDDLVATGFHRNTMVNGEGGTDPEEFRVAAALDRVDTTAATWPGTTMGCAKCHSHRYDPISHREYYSMLAFFDGTGDTGNSLEPTLAVPSDETAARLDVIAAARLAALQRLIGPDAALDAKQKEWEAGLLVSMPPAIAWQPLSVESATASSGASIDEGGDGSWLVPGPVPATDVYELTSAPMKHATFASALRVEALRAAAGGQVGRAGNGNFVLSGLEALESEVASLRAKVPVTPVMRELQGGRATHVLLGANFLSPDVAVTPDIPAALGTWPADLPRNRLGLAQWLTSPENPLTARVVVKRAWARVFGTGIVANVDDFGTQGKLPTSPELLDWLAVDFRESGWDFGHLYRTILSSATYRQTSVVTEALLAADPANRLLARGPRLRLTAEGLRDVALVAAGLLDRTVGGGPSVFPPQPAGTWAMTYSGASWMEDQGTQRWRRGMYTYRRRPAPCPTYALFDAPSFERICTAASARIRHCWRSRCSTTRCSSWRPVAWRGACSGSGPRPATRRASPLPFGALRRARRRLMRRTCSATS